MCDHCICLQMLLHREERGTIVRACRFAIAATCRAVQSLLEAGFLINIINVSLLSTWEHFFDGFVVVQGVNCKVINLQT